MRFKTYINELAFAKGRDTDWDGHRYLLAVFHPDVEYILQGKTHGETSHAIKHLDELAPHQMESIVLNAIQDAIKAPEIYIYSRKKNNITQEGNAARQSLTYRIMINTLDMINDKIELKHPLNNEEKKLLPHIQKITNLYDIFATQLLQSAQNIDNMSINQINSVIHKKPIYFTALQNGKKKSFYLDRQKQYFMIKSNNKINTLFAFKNKSIKDFLEGRNIQAFINPEVKKALM